jgi:hypothetical protein
VTAVRIALAPVLGLGVWVQLVPSPCAMIVPC